MSLSKRLGKNKPYQITFKRVYLNGGKPINRSFFTEQEALAFQNELANKYPAGCKIQIKTKERVEKCIERYEYINGTVNFKVTFSRRYFDKDIIKRFPEYRQAKQFKEKLEKEHPTKLSLGFDKRYGPKKVVPYTTTLQVNGCTIKRVKEGRCKLFLNDKCPYEKYDLCNIAAMENNWPAFKRIGGSK